MPLSVVGRAYVGNSHLTLALWTGALAGLAAALVVLYSWLRVRSGAWTHMDASKPQERLQLNRVLALLLCGGALLGWWLGAPSAVLMGVGLSGAIVVLALLLRKRLKLSLHVAFAVFAASLWWPLLPALVVGLVFCVAVAWSRLALQRHTPAEVGLGAAAGVVCGVLFQCWIAG